MIQWHNHYPYETLLQIQHTKYLYKGNYYAAESMFFPIVIRDANITSKTFHSYACRTREIFSHLDDGSLTREQVITAAGKAWTELIKQAKRLKMEGHEELLEIIRESRNRGIYVPEIENYIEANLKKAKAAVKKARADVKGAWQSLGIEMSDPLGSGGAK